jgi:copper chaperone CopZ
MKFAADKSYTANLENKDYCALCGLPLTSLRVELNKGGNDYYFCCPGCCYVLDVLWESGIKGDGEILRETELFRRCRQMGIISDQSEVNRQKDKKRILPDEIAEINIRVSPFWCGSCCYLVEVALSRMKGILEARASFASDTVTVRFLPRYVSRAEIEQRLASIGYPAISEEIRKASLSRSILFRLGISAFITANVMMQSLTLYSGFFITFTDEVHWLLGYPSLILHWR